MFREEGRVYLIQEICAGGELFDRIVAKVRFLRTHVFVGCGCAIRLNLKGGTSTGLDKTYVPDH